jgi:cytidylate kinase
VTVGIFGGTCSGKTTVADALAAQLAYNVRHCGELIKQLAASRAKSPAELSPLEETRVSARQDRNLIVEGTFLDLVLTDVGNCKLIRLSCNAPVRESRYNVRRGGTSFADRELLDAELRQRLYRDIQNRPADLEIDTSNKAVDDVAREIAQWLTTVRLNTQLDCR